jgi:hypothetical protein
MISFFMGAQYPDDVEEIGMKGLEPGEKRSRHHAYLMLLWGGK